MAKTKAEAILEKYDEELISEALVQALTGNTPVLINLLNKRLPNLQRNENVTKTLDLTQLLITDIKKSLGTIESIENQIPNDLIGNFEEISSLPEKAESVSDLKTLTGFIPLEQAKEIISKNTESKTQGDNTK